MTDKPNVGYEMLVEQAQAGDEGAFAALVERFRDAASAWARAGLNAHADAVEDVVQEAFMTAYRQLEALREPAAFPGWLRRIVHTHVNRVTRRFAPPTRTLDDDAVPDRADDPAHLAERHARERDVRDALDALPPDQRAVTELFYLAGWSQQEIADALALPLTTVKKRLQYARERLRTTLSPHMALRLFGVPDAYADLHTALIGWHAASVPAGGLPPLVSVFRQSAWLQAEEAWTP